jgi:transposase InsO family protein
VVDKFTKYGHFLFLKHPFTTVTFAKIFLDNIYKLHGMPLAIASDRDQVFTSNFWHELFNLAQVQLRTGSAYHPQSDGQMERVNQCMETFLMCFVNACSKKWLNYLSIAEYWYNTTYQSAIG